MIPENPLVDLVIACHSPQRPVGRAVASALDGNSAPHGRDRGGLRVTVVAHNIDAAEIESAIYPAHRSRVRLLEHRDGIHSASGPFNRGLDAATAPFAAIMGSDDTLQAGAVASWLTVQRRSGADAVLTRLALGHGSAIVPTPPTRVPHRDRVRLVADRLAYRSAPLGLLSTAMLRRLDLRLAEGDTVGGDVQMTTRMLAQARIAYDHSGPSYVIGESADDRVTYVIRPLHEQVGFLPPMWTASWFRGLTPRARRAIATKALRIHIFGAVHYRDQPRYWSPVERDALAELTAGVLAAGPGCERPLSLADRSLLDACLDPAVPATELIARSAARRRHGSLGTLLVREPLHALDREAPLRFMAASLLTKLPRP